MLSYGTTVQQLLANSMAITGTELLGRVQWQSYLIQHGTRGDVGLQQEVSFAAGSEEQALLSGTRTVIPTGNTKPLIIMDTPTSKVPKSKKSRTCFDGPRSPRGHM